MPKILKKRALRKSNKKQQRKIIKRINKHSLEKVKSQESSNDAQSKQMSLRETIIYQRMMAQQRSMMGLPQAPQSALDGFKHDMHSTLVKVKDELALEKQHRAALQKQFDAQNHKEKIEANMQIEDNATALTNETTKMQTARLQEEAKGEGEVALQKRLNAEFTEELLQDKHNKKMLEIEKQKLLESGHTDEIIREKELLANEMALLTKNIKILTRNTPEVVQEDKLISGMMAKLCESAQSLLKKYNDIFITKGKWDMMKAQKIPSMITDLQKEKASVVKQLDILSKNITRKESEIDELYALEDEKKRVLRKKEEAEATNEALDNELQKNKIMDGTERTPSEHREYLIKGINESKIAIHDEEQKQLILKQKQKHIDNLELEKEDLDNQEESLKIANTVHAKLKVAQNKKIRDLSKENTTKIDKLEELKIKNAGDKMIKNAINDKTLKKKAAELDLLEQQVVYDQNNLNNEEVIKRSNELRDKTVEIKNKQRETDHLKNLNEQQKAIIRCKIARDVQARMNIKSMDPDESLTQIITNNKLLNLTLDGEDGQKTKNYNDFIEMMNDNSLLNLYLNISLDEFNKYTNGEQIALLDALNDGLSGRVDEVRQFDFEYNASIGNVFDRYWKTIEEASKNKYDEDLQ